MSPSGIQVNKTAILVVLLIIGAVTVYKYPHLFHLTSAKKSEDGSKAGSDKGMATEDIKALDALKKSAENVKVDVRKISIKVGDKVRNYNFWFLAHLSRRLKWAIVIAHRPSSVRPSSVRPSSVCKLSHFQLLLQNRLIDFDETW